jgi:hypothetical protein
MAAEEEKEHTHLEPSATSQASPSVAGCDAEVEERRNKWAVGLNGAEMRWEWTRSI